MLERTRAFISQNRAALILSIFSIAGFAVIWINTPWGIGVGYDSIFYLSAADNVLSGLGLSRLDAYGITIPLTHFPPFYSISIAGLSLITGFETDLTARIIAAVLFGSLVGLTGWLVYRYTKSLLACILGASLILASPVLLDLSFMAMSELLFLVVLLLMVHFLNKFLMNGKMIELVISAGLTALVYLTRYVGITAVALGGLSLLIFRSRPLGKKFRDVVIYGAISLLPMLVFYVRNWYLTGSLTNRIISFHPPTEAQIKQGISTISIWMLPARINSSLRLVVLVLFLIAVAALMVMNYLRSKKEPDSQFVLMGANQFVVLLITYALIYLFMVFASLTFFDASTRLNDRILSPLYVIGILAGLITIWNSELFEEHMVIRGGVIAFCLMFLGINLLRGFDISNPMRNEGKGFSGRDWRSSETIAAISQLPQNTLMFSNEAFAIYYLTDHSANWIPENYDPVKGQEDENYSQRINHMRSEIVEQNGALVVFDSISKHNVYAPIEDLSAGLSLLVKGTDGAVYTSP